MSIGVVNLLRLLLNDLNSAGYRFLNSIGKKMEKKGFRSLRRPLIVFLFAENLGPWSANKIKIVFEFICCCELNQVSRLYKSASA